MLVIYYFTMFIDAFSTKYYGSVIHTKKQFLFYLIPLTYWIKLLINNYNELD